MRIPMVAMLLCAMALVAAPANAAILLNFGATVSDGTNSPMHEIGGVTGTNWNLIQKADVASGIVDDQGNATNVSVNLGTGSSYTMNWDVQPTGASSLGAVFKTGIYSGNGKSATYSSSGELGIRISGLAPGTYDVYVAGCNTNSGNSQYYRQYYEVVDSASGNTTYSAANSYLRQIPSLADFLAGTTTAGDPNTWDKSSYDAGLADYSVFEYTIGANEDIVLAVSTRGFVSMVGIVPEPATMSLLAFGGIAALIRRRR